MNKKVQDWQELKFGMFIHFGLYSLAGGVWKGNKITRGYSEQILSHGYLPQREYELLAPQFSIENFDADNIVALAKEAGMQYLVITAKHHDGFCLFDTKTTEYKSSNTPCKKDIIRALSDACKKQGLGFGLYYSWIDWHFPQALPISAHNSDPIPREHQDYNIAQLTELLGSYGPICELWMDMGAPTKEQSEEVYALVQRLQSQCMVNGRIWNDCGDFLTMGDNKLPTVILDVPWQTPASIYHETWGYRSWQERGELPKKIVELSNTLRRVVSEGGNYLLNIGLRGDGSIEGFEQEVLRGIGASLQKQPLERDTKKDPPQTIIIKESPQILPPGTLSYRYSGAEYYSYRPIPTSLSWTVEIPESKKEDKGQSCYEIRWCAKEPLTEELKLCFVMEEESFCFSLQRERSEDPVFSSVNIVPGLHTISLHTVGDPITRPELKNIDLSLKITRIQGVKQYED
ncbi:alpha-L-fucosidase [Treponema sp.]